MDVEVWVYDISNGMAENLFRTMFGIEIKGIWHTSIVVFSKEYYFFSGIKESIPGNTHFGAPIKRIPFGKTEVDKKDFELFLAKNKDLYTEHTYDLLRNNCNHFSNCLLKYLVKKEVPNYIMELSNALQDTPFGEMVKSAFGMMNLRDVE